MKFLLRLNLILFFKLLKIKHVLGIFSVYRFLIYFGSSGTYHPQLVEPFRVMSTEWRQWFPLQRMLKHELGTNERVSAESARHNNNKGAGGRGRGGGGRGRSRIPYLATLQTRPPPTLTHVKSHAFYA